MSFQRVLRSGKQFSRYACKTIVVGGRGEPSAVDTGHERRLPCRPSAHPHDSFMTSPYSRIAELPSHAGQTVRVRGWVTHVRSSGKVAFIVMRDGSGLLQAVLVKNAYHPKYGSATGS